MSLAGPEMIIIYPASSFQRQRTRQHGLMPRRDIESRAKYNPSHPPLRVPNQILEPFLRAPNSTTRLCQKQQWHTSTPPPSSHSKRKENVLLMPPNQQQMRLVFRFRTQRVPNDNVATYRNGKAPFLRQDPPPIHPFWSM